MLNKSILVVLVFVRVANKDPIVALHFACRGPHGRRCAASLAEAPSRCIRGLQWRAAVVIRAAQPPVPMHGPAVHEIGDPTLCEKNDTDRGLLSGMMCHKPSRQICLVDEPNLPGEMQATVTLKSVSCGTEIRVVQEGVPEVIPVEMGYLGWRESLAQLATLVEPDIPG